MHVSREYLASGEKEDRSERVLVLKSGHVDDDVQVPALDDSARCMDERVVTSMKCWIDIEEKMSEISGVN